MKLFAMVLLLSLVATGMGQEPTAAKPSEPVEKLGENLYRVGKIRIDTAKREISLPGKINSVTAIEFIACAKDGAKKYESAIELDTDAITFNLALILIGFDKSKSVPPRHHFDPVPPQGQPIEISVAWKDKRGANRSVKAEELIWNAETKKTLPAGDWVYTGSIFQPDGRYLAEVEGSLIGFVHTPAPIIERTTFQQTSYGVVQLNPSLGLAAETEIMMTLKAVRKPSPGSDNK